MEQPRQKRAAAVAAQKNWQILTKDTDLDIIGDDEKIMLGEDTTTMSNANNKRLKQLSPITIDMEEASASVRKRRKRTRDEIDGDYSPSTFNITHQVMVNGHLKTFSPKQGSSNTANQSHSNRTSQIQTQAKVQGKSGNIMTTPIIIRTSNNQTNVTHRQTTILTSNKKGYGMGKVLSHSSNVSPKPNYYILVRNEDPFEANTSTIIAKPVDIAPKKPTNLSSVVFRVLPNELIVFPDVEKAEEECIVDFGNNQIKTKKKKRKDEKKNEEKAELEEKEEKTMKENNEKVERIEGVEPIKENGEEKNGKEIEGVDIEGVEVVEKSDNNIEMEDESEKVESIEDEAVEVDKVGNEEKSMDVDREEVDVEGIGIDIEQIEKEKNSSTGTITMDCSDSDYELPGGERSKDLEDEKVVEARRRRYTRKIDRTNRRQGITTGALEMSCDIMEDEYADKFNVLCEDDILSERQFEDMKKSKEEYEKYMKHVLEVKNLKGNVSFVREDACASEVGVTTTETSKLVTLQPTKQVKRTIVQQTPTTPIQSRPQTAVRWQLPAGTRFQSNQQTPQIQRMATPNILRILQNAQFPSNNLPTLSVNNQGQILPQQHMVVSRANNSPNAPYTIIPNATLRLVVPGMNTQTVQLVPQGMAQVIPNQTLFPISSNQTFLLHNPTATVSSSLRPPIKIHSTSTPSPTQNSTGVRISQPLITRSLSDLERKEQQKQIQKQQQKPATIYNLIKNAVPKDRSPSLVNVVLGKDKGAANTQVKASSNLLEKQKADCLAMIKGGSKKLNSQNHFSIKPLPFAWPSTLDSLIQSLVKLDNILMKEKFKEFPLKWMINAKLLEAPKCKKCNGNVVPIQRKNVSKKEAEYRDEWQCSNASCRLTIPVEHPSIFSDAQFKSIAASQLLFVIYYWAIQVDVEDLIKTGQINLTIESIYHVWRKVQNICTRFLLSNSGAIGSSKSTVEVATVLVGNYHVVGAMDTSMPNICKLGVIPNSLALANNEELYKWVKYWIKPSTVIKTCESKFAGLSQCGFNVFVMDKKSFFDNLETTKLNNVGGYMIQHLQKLFKDIDCNSLSRDCLQDLLSELQWRELFGRDPHSAFTNIIKHIAAQCAIKPNWRAQAKTYSASCSAMQKSKQDPSPSPSSNIQPTRPPSNLPSQLPVKQQQLQTRKQFPNTNSQAQSQYVQPKVILEGPDILYVDEYFYASLKLKGNAARSKNKQVEDVESSSKSSIQCHFCQMFFDNLLIVKHLLEHLEQQRKGRVRKGDDNDIECKHCLRFFNSRSMEIHEELSSLKLVKHSCRICAIPLFTRYNYINHMKINHFPSEMPYYCEICTYRSSFQKDLFEHFEKEHSGLDSVQCLFCFRVLSSLGKSNFSQFIYTHLTNHYAVATVYKCDKCVLTFINKNDLKNHCFKAHNSAKLKYDDKYEVISYTLSPDERQFSVRAAENELFTPNTQSNAATAASANASASIELQSTDNVEDMSLEVTPDISDFLIEPEVEMNLTDGKEKKGNLMLAQDIPYTNIQLERIMRNNLKFSENEKTLVTATNNIVRCKECVNLITVDHFSAKCVCSLCNYTTHCKNSYAEHMIKGHADESVKFVRRRGYSELGVMPTLLPNPLKCASCPYTTKIGNDMATHLAKKKHSMAFYNSSQ